MSLSSEDIKKIIVNTELTSLEARKLCLEIGLEISIIAKELAKLNVKKTTRQSFKPHEFKSNKKRLAQLLSYVNYLKQIK
jgi:ribosomal protein L29